MSAATAGIPRRAPRGLSPDLAEKDPAAFADQFNKGLEQMLPAIEQSTGQSGPEILKGFQENGIGADDLERALKIRTPEAVAGELQKVGYPGERIGSVEDVMGMFTDFWGKLDQPSQLAISIGLPLALVGLASKAMGSGGLLSTLMMILGGGAAAAGGTGGISKLVELLGGMGGEEGAGTPPTATQGGSTPAPGGDDPMGGLTVEQATDLYNYANATDPAARDAYYERVAPIIREQSGLGPLARLMPHSMIQPRVDAAIKSRIDPFRPLLDAMNKR